jgi:rare lipoprotein A
MGPNKLFLPVLLITLFTSCSYRIVETGKASYYADKFKGRKTANGDTFRQNKKTAAHKTLPFGTKVWVTNVSNGKTVKVRINDRGPFVAGRVIDLSKKAARKIDMIKAGVSEVELKYRSKKR